MNIQTSSHFDRTLALIVLGTLLLLGLYAKIKHSINDYVKPSVHVLKPADKEELLYNSNTHTLTTVTAKGTTNQYTRNPDIELLKNGDVKVDSKSYGFEEMPFLGFGYSDILRIHAGVSWFYYKKLDLNTQLAFSQKIGVAIQPFTTVSYALYDNTSVFAGVNLLDVMLRETPEYTVGILVKL